MNFYLKTKTKEGKKMKTKKNKNTKSRFDISCGALLLVLCTVLVIGFIV